MPHPPTPCKVCRRCSSAHLRKHKMNFKNTKTLIVAATVAMSMTAHAADVSFDYRILATSKTSTMENELNQAAAAGFRFSKAMGGKSANGGQEAIVAVVKDTASD